MGCGVSKDDIAEPRPMQSHGRDKLQLTGKGALKPIQVTSVRDSTCISSLNISSSAFNNPASPPSVFIHTPDSLTSDEDESDLDSSYEFPSNLSIEEVDENVSRTTALAALRGEKTRTDIEDVEERVEAILAADEVLSTERGQECSTCAFDMLSGAAAFEALMSNGPVVTQQNLADDLSRARVGRVAVISGPEPIHWEAPLRKAEIIDLAEEPDIDEVLVLENTPEKQEDQSDQEHESSEPAEPAKLAEAAVLDHGQENSDTESVSSLTEQPTQQELKVGDAVDTHKTALGPEPRKSKLPPLTIVPPILVEIPANPFGKPALPIVVKQDLMEVKVPAVLEAEIFEDLSARTPTMALDSANGDNFHDMSKSSPVTERCGTPTPATKSPADSEWRSLHRDTPDPDIEDIVLFESQELDSLPLIPMLDCHGIHMDKKDLTSPSLRLIS